MGKLKCFNCSIKDDCEIAIEFFKQAGTIDSQNPNWNEYQAAWLNVHACVDQKYKESGGVDKFINRLNNIKEKQQ